MENQKIPSILKIDLDDAGTFKPVIVSGGPAEAPSGYLKLLEWCFGSVQPADFFYAGTFSEHGKSFYIFCFRKKEDALAFRLVFG